MAACRDPLQSTKEPSRAVSSWETPHRAMPWPFRSLPAMASRKRDRAESERISTSGQRNKRLLGELVSESLSPRNQPPAALGSMRRNTEARVLKAIYLQHTGITHRVF